MNINKLRKPIIEFCNRYGQPILFARVEMVAEGARLIFGIAGQDAANRLKIVAKQAFEDEFSSLEIVDVSAADSLEELTGQNGMWIFDPTMALRRAEAAIVAADTLRADGWSGRLWFELKHRAFFLQDTQDHSWAEQFGTRLEEETARREVEFADFPEIRCGVPNNDAIAVDRASALRSASTQSSQLPSFRFRLKPLIAAILGLGFLGLAQPAAAADPAVSALSAKLGAQGGSLDGKGAGIGFGSIMAPLGHSLGLQVDAGAGSIDSNAYWGTGAHLFWRDPSIGLLGFTYSYQRWNDFDFGFLHNSSTAIVKDAFMHRGGMEGELYLSRFTLSGHGGYQDGTVKSDGYGQLKLRYYATDDLAVHVTGDHFGGQNLIRGGVEYRPGLEALSGLSLFAEGGYGSQDYGMGQAGIRIYFGKPATLINRDRRTDPDSLIPDDTNALIQQIKNMRVSQPYVAPSGGDGNGNKEAAFPAK